MATIHMDYGTVRYNSQGNPIFPNDVKEYKKHTQVYRATHDREDKRLPYMERSFISFTYGGKNIEDFNLIAITENNAIQRKMYAPFSDNTTESDVWDGQIYWSSHYDANTLDLTLTTDGMTEIQMDEFRMWFVPGPGKELVLAEHPNRGIIARVSEPPEFSMLPFEEKTTVRVLETDYETSTTLYKGNISLKFVMDEPFWYSLVNVLDRKQNEFNIDVNQDGDYNDNGESQIEGYKEGYWYGVDKEEKYIFNDKDALKIILEDGIPCTQMFTREWDESSSNDWSIINLLFGNESGFKFDLGYSATGSRIGWAKIVNADESSSPTIEEEGAFGAHIAYNVIDKNEGFQIGEAVANHAYFYYAGTAPSYPIINFSLIPTISSGYINFPKNDINANGNKYNTIFIACTQSPKELRFTTPGVLTAFNQVIKIFKENTLSSTNKESFREKIRDNVKHWATRDYANYVLENNNTSSNAISAMASFIGNSTYNFLINCKTGECIGVFPYLIKNRLGNWVTNNQPENVGDMIIFNNLVITEKNYPSYLRKEDSDAHLGVVSWPLRSGNTWNTKTLSRAYRLWADCTLTNVHFTYKHMYY